ncbi:hexosyltransferase [Elysia marginata]|uniref:Hexosyltransferase n=1 Tax=Elysia marginata TaxID=1093978 RepID=A0AAV4IAK4_9GAST|nr:hexosyltransferase [Elysia marginata]
MQLRHLHPASYKLPASTGFESNKNLGTFAFFIQTFFFYNVSNLEAPGGIFFNQTDNSSALINRSGDDSEEPIGPMVGKIIGEDFFHDVITPSISCSGRDVELVICVPVKRDAWQKRKAIRQTWGSYGNSGVRSTHTDSSTAVGNFVLPTPSPSNIHNPFPISDDGNATVERKGDVVLIFFLGSSSTLNETEEQETIEREAQVYGDIYQADYIDTYENLTLKSISMFNFVALKCPNARYMAKVDDDVYINIANLLTVLQNHTEVLTQNNISGAQYNASASNSTDRENPLNPLFAFGDKFKDAPVIRNKTDKWYTPFKVFKDKCYPSYLSGTAYAMSGSTALEIHKATQRVPFFWMEDIYIMGLCAKEANVALIGDNRFAIYKRKPTGCSLRDKISSHEHTIKELYKIHRELNNPSLKCKRKK